MREPEKLIALCKEHKIYIQTHNFPDPDAIGAAFGLQQLLEHYGIQSVICHEGQIDKLSSVKMLDRCGIQMHDYASLKAELQEEDRILLVDCQKGNGNTTDFVGDEFAVIDHHPTYKTVEYAYADLTITGSCCSVIADYYRILGVEPSVQAATAMLYGLRIDTLQLSRGVTAFDVEIYGYLFRYASSQLLTELESNNMEFSDLKAYGTAIDHIRVYGKVAFSYLEFDCPDALIAVLSDFILALDEVEVTVLYAHRKNGYKFSVRSERADVPAGTLIHTAFDGLGSGGGHATMAGGFLERETLEKLGSDVFAATQQLFMKVLEKDYSAAL